MPETAHVDRPERPRAADLGYLDATVHTYQGPDDVLVFLPDDEDEIRHDSAVVAGPESHVDVSEVR